MFHNDEEERLFKAALRWAVKWTLLFWLACIFPFVLAVGLGSGV